MEKDSNGNPPQGFKRPGGNPSSSDKADWTECNPKKLVDLIAEASKKNGAVRFGYTRDGGAYSIGVYLGTEYFTDYIRPSEEIDQYLETLTESFREYSPQDTARAPQKRGGKH